MTLGKREYNEADMLRMQRDAEERVREMQNRAREVVENDNDNTQQQPRNRNWTSGPNRRNSNYRRQSQQNQEPRQPHPPKEDTPPPPPPAPEPPPAKENSTIVGDIMGALNLDEDYLLIIGLLLILINQRADTTLILALAYLLI